MKDALNPLHNHFFAYLTVPSCSCIYFMLQLSYVLGKMFLRIMAIVNSFVFGKIYFRIMMIVNSFVLNSYYNLFFLGLPLNWSKDLVIYLCQNRRKNWMGRVGSSSCQSRFWQIFSDFTIAKIYICISKL